MTILRERLTYSLNGAAFAVAKGIRLLRTFKEPGSKTTFVLDDGYGQASEALHEYWNGEALINARTYSDTRRYLLEVMNTPEAHKENSTHATTATAD